MHISIYLKGDKFGSLKFTEKHIPINAEIICGSIYINQLGMTVDLWAEL